VVNKGCCEGGGEQLLGAITSPAVTCSRNDCVTVLESSTSTQLLRTWGLIIEIHRNVGCVTLVKVFT